MNRRGILPIDCNAFDDLDREIVAEFQLRNARVCNRNGEVVSAGSCRRADNVSFMLLQPESGRKFTGDNAVGVRHNSAGDRQGQSVGLSRDGSLRGRHLHLQVLPEGETCS